MSNKLYINETTVPVSNKSYISKTNVPVSHAELARCVSLPLIRKRVINVATTIVRERSEESEESEEGGQKARPRQFV